MFFSNPLLEFISIYHSDVPQSVIDSAKSLNYRNHISVHITIDKKLFEKNVTNDLSENVIDLTFKFGGVWNLLEGSCRYLDF